VDNELADESAEPPPIAASSGPVRRCVVAAGAGAGIVLAWWAFFRMFPGLPFSLVGQGESGVDCQRSEAVCKAVWSIFGPMISVLITVTLVLTLSLVIGIGVLWLVRVRPALSTALLGPVLAWVIGGTIGGSVRVTAGEVPFELALYVAIGYAVAAFVTTTTVPRHWRLGVLGAVVVAWGLHALLA
jgi:hypothetical protein